MKFKKIIAFLSAFYMIFSCFSTVGLSKLSNKSMIFVGAKENDSQAVLNYSILDDGTISITGCSNESVLLTIPEEINGKQVTSIQMRAFYNNKTLKTVILPDGLLTIGTAAFMGCTSLTNINLPESLLTIADGAFSGCTKLKDISIPSDTRVEGFSFENTPWLEEQRAISPLVFVNSVLLDGITCTGEAMIYSKITFTDETTSTSEVPSQVTEIASYAFAGSEVTSVDIPESVDTIGEYAFVGCNNMNSIYIPSTVTTIGNQALGYTINSTQDGYIARTDFVIQGESGTAAETYANTYGFQFQNVDSKSKDAKLFLQLSNNEITVAGCQSSAISLEIPDSFNNHKVTIIGESAFVGCDELQYIHLPDTIRTIESNAFNSCKNLSFVDMPNSVTYISETAFSGCTEFTFIGEHGCYAETYAIENNIPFYTVEELKELDNEDKNSEVANTIISGKDDYCFANTKDYFRGYQMSEKMYSLLSAQANNIEWENISFKVTDKAKWNGSCFGMAAVEILAKLGYISANNIDSFASALYDWKAPNIDENVESVINYYHMLQYSNVFTNAVKKYRRMTNQAQIQNLIELATAVENGGNPVLVCFEYTTSASSQKCGSGHAIVAYGAEYGKWETSKGEYDCRILISDPNIIGFEDTACIYINTSTYYWEIPYYQEKMYACFNMNQTKDAYARIRFVTVDPFLIDVFGYTTRKSSNTMDITEEEKDSIITIDSVSTNFGVSFYNSNLLGGIYDTTCELDFFSYCDATKEIESTVNAYLPVSDIAYEYFEKSIGAFDTMIEYTNTMFEADVTNGNYAIFQPDKSVEFCGENSDYTLSIVANDEYHPTDWYKIEVSGYNADFVKLSIAKDGYIISGNALKEGLFITASNRTEEAKINLITNAESVYIYEIDIHTIGVKLDQDGDGIYESDFLPSYLGDVNLDGNIGVVDVVTLQKYLHTTKTFTKEQFIASDLNQDGIVNIFDLAILKQKVIKNSVPVK